MEIDSFGADIVPTVDTTIATIPIAAHPTTTIPQSVTVIVSSTVSAPKVPILPAYAKPFPDISKIEVFSGQNFKCLQERIYSTLDMHGVA